MEPIRTAARILPHAARRLQGRLSRAVRDTPQMSDNQPATELGDASASGEGIVQDGTKAVSTVRRDTQEMEVAMAGKRRSALAGRKKLSSPGRPPVAIREALVGFWAAIAAGPSEDAAAEVGVSMPVGSRWFRRSGGMRPTHLAVSAAPLSGRYLSFAERDEIALLRAQGHGVRHIARSLNRSPGTIFASRELRRNAATRGGNLEYRATTAQ